MIGQSQSICRCKFTQDVIDIFKLDQISEILVEDNNISLISDQRAYNVKDSVKTSN